MLEGKDDGGGRILYPEKIAWKHTLRNTESERGFAVRRSSAPALRPPRGAGRAGRWAGARREGSSVSLRLNHVGAGQRPTQY